jgi:hypothetical protein
MTTPTPIPVVPALPAASPGISIPPHYPETVVRARDAAWLEHSRAQVAEIERLNALLEAGDSTPRIEFSFDIGDIGGTPDAPQTEAKKLADRKAMLGVPYVKDVRVFFGTSVPRWDDERIQALDPTIGDTFVLSTLTTDFAGLRTFYANAPDEWRGNFRSCYGHEREANLLTDALLAAWLNGNARMAAEVDASGYMNVDEHFGKLTLFYSQQIDQRIEIPTREEMHGGQNFGFFGEDCYHPRARLSRGFYETAPNLFGPILDFAQSVGRPCLIGEWGGERAAGDTTGQGRAAAITEGGEYLKSRHGQNGLRIIGANWWWAYGLRDGVVLDHNLHAGGNVNAPEVAAFRALAHS